MKSDALQSLDAIAKEMEHESDYVTVCHDKKITFAAEADEYCALEANGVHCAIFRPTLQHQDKADEKTGKGGDSNSQEEDATEVIIRNAN
ncbi:unnamed protein product [Nippostrongylus brasiliensis]|uniref:Ground-like domain-containing protein n=1 Tax=Nippostrongylus brasiliensis TaxID=27835 RepID=A0A0N4XWM9_NIPBR|nr:unnamed protein product [Nippostrongylus brasiliensis]